MKIFFFIVFLKAICAQMIPKMLTPVCRENQPPELPSECCVMPDLFNMDNNEACGNAEMTVSGPSLRGSPECAERTCFLRTNDLLFDNDEIDNESVKQYLDEWVSKRREYQAGIDACKDRCLGSKPLFGPAQMCAADKLMFCLSSSLMNKCPDWHQTQPCRILRSYLSTCMPYYDQD